MLQPAELQSVAERFAGEIASLRKFLAQADVPQGSAQSAHGLAARLVDDRAFHRDFTSHIWVLLDEASAELRYADLLGIVAVAISGIRGAGSLEEDDAHALLRSLMEAKHAFEGKPLAPVQAAASPAKLREVQAIASPPEAEPAISRSAARRALPKTPDEPAKPQIVHAVHGDAVEASQVRRRRFRYSFIAIAAVGVLVLCIALFRRDRTTGESGTASAPSASPSLPAPSDRLPRATSSDSEPAPAVFPTKTGSSRLRPAPSANLPPASPEAASGSVTDAAPSATGVPSPGQVSDEKAFAAAGAPIERVPPATAPPGVGVAASSANQTRSPLIASRVSRPAAPAPVAADALSRQLDSPRPPAYSIDSEEARKKYPRLLRRHANDAALNGAETGETLSAELRAPDLAGAVASYRPAAGSATTHASVRSTCLGMMAGNLVYGPTPAYPAAAASARVQGQVKIQATVDRDGSINSARVISGPPALREAALDAVQRWRFKPFLTAGKPAPTGAMAVVEFELQ